MYFFLRFHLFYFLERGREREREGEKHECVVALHMAPTEDLTCNPGMCPDWKSNRLPFGSQPLFNPLRHTCQGWILFILIEIIYLFSESGGGRDKERERNMMCERNINQLPLPRAQPVIWPATQACALTRHQTGDLSVCKLVLNQLSYPSQGSEFFLWPEPASFCPVMGSGISATACFKACTFY